MTANELMNKIKKHSIRIKHICFGKVRNCKGLESDKELNDLYKENMLAISSEDTQQVDGKLAERLLGVQRVQYEKKLDYLKELKASKGKSAVIFKLKEKVVGSKKGGMESVSLNDHITGEMIYEPEKLKEASSNYLRNLLTNREPKEGYKEHFSTLRRLHDSRMNEIYEDDDKLTRNDFEMMIRKLKTKKADKYKFLLNGGKSFQDVLFCLHKKVWESEDKPAMWEQSNCTMLYKGKGLKSEFSNQRFIHSKNEIPKSFETLVIEKTKPKIIKKCSKFQIGGLPGHQAAEHLFTLKSIISLFLSRGIPLFLNCFDLEKYLDSEVLIDAMDNLYKCEVKGKLYRLIYLLNKNNLIKIKTPVGITNEFQTGENVTQGSVGGGLISSINLDILMRHFFSESEYEVNYGNVQMGPIIYQDDLTRLATSGVVHRQGSVWWRAAWNQRC